MHKIRIPIVAAWQELVSSRDELDIKEMKANEHLRSPPERSC